MSNKKYICVYGGASERIDDSIKKDVKELGKIIAENGLSLVYGGGATGCMGAVADGVSENGGYVFGIAPYFINEYEELFPCDKTIMVDTMSERKLFMEKFADMFIIVPGGVGTMDELFEILTLKYLKQLDVPIVILNLNGYYDSLVALIDDMVKYRAAGIGIKELIEVIDDVNDDRIINYFKKIKN